MLQGLHVCHPVWLLLLGCQAPRRMILLQQCGLASILKGYGNLFVWGQHCLCEDSIVCVGTEVLLQSNSVCTA